MVMCFLQAQGSFPGASEAIEAAKTSGRWESVVLVVVFLAVLLGFFILGKYILDQAARREDRMAKRIDALDEQLHGLQDKYAQRLVELTTQMAGALVEVRQTQVNLANSITDLANKMGEVNGDIKQMCQLLQVCPCLFVGKHRGRYKLVDKATGDEVQFEEIS